MLSLSSAQAEQWAWDGHWKTFEMENGMVVAIDMLSVRDHDGIVVVCSDIQKFKDGTNTCDNPDDVRRLVFSCEGHYTDFTGSPGPTLRVPPRSVAAVFEKIACEGNPRFKRQ
jgi:hypothetical protein